MISSSVKEPIITVGIAYLSDSTFPEMNCRYKGDLNMAYQGKANVVFCTASNMVPVAENMRWPTESAERSRFNEPSRVLKQTVPIA